MGNGSSASAYKARYQSHEESKDATKVSKEIDKIIRSDNNDKQREIKLLLLGTGGSGKSTLAKQMKILRANGFSDSESEFFVQFIHQNLIISLSALISNFVEKSGEQIDTQLQEHVKLIQDIAKAYVDVGLDMDDEIRDSSQRLWNYQPIRSYYNQHKDKIELPDSATYLLEKMEELCSDKYKPCQEDIIRCRIVTRSVAELPFSHKGMQFLLIDVGGQRTERRKWIHYFSDVAGVLFVAALSEYNQTLDEDKEVNRTEESIAVFKDITHNKYFKSTPVLLFFNKADVFVRKIQHHPLQLAFPDYEGSNSFEETSAYIRGRFLAKKPPKTSAYVHLTNATDTQNIDYVFNDCLDIIMKANIKNTGIE